jgi:hypothetical protein
VSIIEALGKPVKITYGSYSNIKVKYGDGIGASRGVAAPRMLLLTKGLTPSFDCLLAMACR